MRRLLLLLSIAAATLGVAAFASVLSAPGTAVAQSGADRDRDGVPDAEDTCPKAPERHMMRGPAGSAKGCPAFLFSANMGRNLQSYASGSPIFNVSEGFVAFFECVPSNCAVRGQLMVSERTRKALGLPTRRFGKVREGTGKENNGGAFVGALAFKVSDRVSNRFVRVGSRQRPGPGPVRKLEVTLVLDVTVPQSATTDRKHYTIRKSDVLKYYRVDANDKPIGLDICDATIQIRRPKDYMPQFGPCRYSF